MPQRTPSSRLLARCALALGLAMTIPATWAQWQWIDGSGRKVFSDTAPPAGTPDKNILKRPSGASSPMAPAAPSVPNPSAPAAPTLPQVSDKDPELEARKKQADAQEEAQRKAEADRVARLRSDNCDRARRAKSTLDSGTRIATTNAKGERVFLDDQARAAEVQRVEQAMRTDCGPLPAQ